MKKITTFRTTSIKTNKKSQTPSYSESIPRKSSTKYQKKLDYVSRRTGYEIKFPKSNSDKFIIIFTVNGYRKLFAKIIALENPAPTLVNFAAKAFIKPLEDITEYKSGKNESCNCWNYEIKMSELQITLLDYNIETKQLKIDVYLPNHNELKHCKDLKDNINWIVMQIVSEITYSKHIKEIQLHQMPL